MGKIKIAIDIDEVVLEYLQLYLDYFKEKTGRSASIHDFPSYHFWEPLGISRELSYDFAYEVYDIEQDRIGLVSGAKEALFRLRELFDLVFITARPISIKESTYSILVDRLGFHDFQLLFSSDDKFLKNKGMNKGQICHELDIPYLIEDNFGFINGENYDHLSIFLLDKPWNQYELKDNVMRVKSWDDIVSFLEAKHG